MKKFFTYPVFVILFLSFIAMTGFGAIVKYHYDGGKKYQFLQKLVMPIASFPLTLKNMIEPAKPIPLTKHKDKKRFEQFIKNKRNALLVLTRYDKILSRSVIEIIDLNNFEIIHTYKHDIDEMYNQVKNIEEFSIMKIDDSLTKFVYRHPLLLEDGSIISDSDHDVAFKIDFCSKLQWINDEEIFKHSKMLDHEGNIWIPGIMNPQSQYVKKYSIKNFNDDSIIKINTNGKILFNKSVTEILIENDFIDQNIFFSGINPIYLTDIEPAFSDTEYWKEGDTFLSIKNQSAIIHYRPSTNKVINYITGPFAQQYDVDIISDKEISIFNNNNFFFNNKYSEVLVYNFDTKTFKKLFNDQLQKENFKTESEGLSHIFKDGSLLVEEQNHGRILLFNNKGEKEWEYINKDKNGDIGLVNWSRIIEDKIFIDKFKLLVKNIKCYN